MMPEAIIAHESSGRLRIKIPASRGDAGVLAAYRDHLSQCPGIISVEINPITGSMLFLHQTSVAAIFDYAHEKNVFARKVPVAGNAQEISGPPERHGRYLQGIRPSDPQPDGRRYGSEGDGFCGVGDVGNISDPEGECGRFAMACRILVRIQYFPKVTGRR